MTTRWAMVGTGLMLDLIGRDFALVDEVDLRVIVSRTQERADASAARFGIPEGSADLDAVLARDDIDLVYVATPHTEHLRIAMTAIDAGKHVLVEKPMTTSAADTRLLCEHARRNGRFAMEAMWMAFNPVIQEVDRRVADGAIGDVGVLHANFGMPFPFDSGSRMWKASLGGGSTLDQGVYAVSLAQLLFGNPISVSSRGTVDHDVDTEVATTLEFATGARASLLTSMRVLTPLDAYLGGTTGHLRINGPFWSTNGFSVSGPATDDVTIPPEGMGYVPMLRAVNQAVEAGLLEHELRTHADTVAVAETLDEILRQVHGVEQ